MANLIKAKVLNPFSTSQDLLAHEKQGKLNLVLPFQVEFHQKQIVRLFMDSNLKAMGISDFLRLQQLSLL